MKKKTGKSTDRRYWLVYGLYAVVLLFILVAVYFLGDMSYACKREYLPNGLLLAGGVVLICALAWLANRIRLDSLRGKRHWRLLVVAFFGGMFLIQVAAVVSYFFVTRDWDAGTIFDACERMAHGLEPDNNGLYFSQNPNNLFFAWLFIRVIRLTDLLLGQAVRGAEYLAMIVVQCAISQATGFMLYVLARKLAKRDGPALLAYLLYVLLVGLSPWVAIPYTDSVALFIPTSILLVYVCWPKGRLAAVKWLLVGVLTMLAYRLKPQGMIVTIAIALCELVRALRRGFIKRWWKQIVRAGAGLAAGLLLCLLLTGWAVNSLPLTLDTEQAFGLRHFLLLGLNEDSMGVWNIEDVYFSDSFDDQATRRAATDQVLRTRIEHMGVKGLALQGLRKTLTNYNDGTFFWGGEGNFFGEVSEPRVPVLSQFTRGLYYPEGSLYRLWSNFEQAVWLAILTLGLLSCLRKPNRRIAVVMLSVVGLTLFNMIFEARARYLYTYLPYFILLTSIGIGKLRDSKQTIGRAR